VAPTFLRLKTPSNANMAQAAVALENFEYIRNIGKGSYGEVTLARHKRDRKQVCDTFKVIFSLKNSIHFYFTNYLRPKLKLILFARF